MLNGTVPEVVPAYSSAGSTKGYSKKPEVGYSCKICGGNPIDEIRCRGISGVSRKNAQCVEFNCDSPWRVCRACLLLGDAKLKKRVVKDGLCQFHIDHGAEVRVSDETEEITPAEADEAAAAAAQTDMEADEAGRVKTETPVPTSEDGGAEKTNGTEVETEVLASVPEDVEARKAEEGKEDMSDFSEFIKEQMKLRGLSIEDLAEKTKISEVGLQALEKGVAVDLSLGMARQIIMALCLNKPEIESFISLASKAGVIQESTQRELKAAILVLVEEIRNAGVREGGDTGERKLENDGNGQDKTAAVAPDTIPVKELLNSITDRERHGKFIKEMMQRLSLRVTDFMEKTGMSNPNVTFLRKGSIPRPETAAKIAEAFGFNEEDTALYLRILEELRKRKGPYNLPIQRKGEQSSLPPQLSSSTGKFDGPLFAKSIIWRILSDARKRLAEETPEDKRLDLLLEQAGFGEDNIATDNINLVSLRELCSLLDLTDGEKATVAELLKFVQNEFAVTIKGRNTELIKLFLFGSK